MPAPNIHSEYDNNFAFHPWNVMLFLALVAIGGLFFGHFHCLCLQPH